MTKMTVDEALQFAGDATKGATFYDGMRMTDLPHCKLCGHIPESTIVNMSTLNFCSNTECPISAVLLTFEQWRKLMYVPIKKIHTRRDNTGSYGHTYKMGYNAAIDAIEKGGE